MVYFYRNFNGLDKAIAYCLVWYGITSAETILALRDEEFFNETLEDIERRIRLLTLPSMHPPGTPYLQEIFHEAVRAANDMIAGGNGHYVLSGAHKLQIKQFIDFVENSQN